MKKESLSFKGWAYFSETKEDALLAMHGLEWALIALNLDQEIRSKIKYGHTFKTPDDALKWARECLNDYIKKYNLTLDMIQ